MATVRQVEEKAPWTETQVEDVKPASSGVDFQKLLDENPASTALTVMDEEAAVAANGLPVYSAEPDLDMSDLYIPKLRLANGLSAEVNAGTAKAGQWVLFGHDAVDTVNVVVLGVAKRRELREKTAEGNLLCTSPDSVNGVGSPGGPCALCPLSQPVPPELSGDGKFHPASCTLIYSYQVFSLTHNAMAILEFKKTATNAARQLNTVLKTSPHRSRVIILGKNQQQNAARQTYYVPTILPRQITEDEQAIVDEGLISL
jgi:hypothetical protein